MYCTVVCWLVDFLDSPWFIVDGTDNGVIYFFSCIFILGREEKARQKIKDDIYIIYISGREKKGQTLNVVQ